MDPYTIIDESDHHSSIPDTDNEFARDGIAWQKEQLRSSEPNKTGFVDAKRSAGSDTLATDQQAPLTASNRPEPQIDGRTFGSTSQTRERDDIQIRRAHDKVTAQQSASSRSGGGEAESSRVAAVGEGNTSALRIMNSDPEDAHCAADETETSTVVISDLHDRDKDTFSIQYLKFVLQGDEEEWLAARLDTACDYSLMAASAACLLMDLAELDEPPHFGFHGVTASHDGVRASGSKELTFSVRGRSGRYRTRFYIIDDKYVQGRWEILFCEKVTKREFLQKKTPSAAMPVERICTVASVTG